MRSIWIAGGLVLGALVACAGGSADDDGSEQASDGGQEAHAEPGTPIHNDDPTDAGDASKPADPDEDAGKLDERGGSRTCAAGANGHQAHTTVVWSKQNQTISFATMTSTVTNIKGLDDNSLTVSVGTKGQNDYVQQVDSGPILKSGTAVDVPLPQNFTIPAGKALRIDHRFDDGGGGVLSAPCFMYF